MARTGRLRRGDGWRLQRGAREQRAGLTVRGRAKKPKGEPGSEPGSATDFRLQVRFTKVDYTRAFHADVIRKLEGMIGKTAFSPARPYIFASVE